MALLVFLLVKRRILGVNIHSTDFLLLLLLLLNTVTSMPIQGKLRRQGDKEDIQSEND